MAATINLKATVSDKYLRVVDKLNGKEWPKSKKLTAGGASWKLTVSTHDKSNGEISIDVSRDGKKYAVHESSKWVVDGSEYQIDDAKLPPADGGGGALAAA